MNFYLHMVFQKKIHYYNSCIYVLVLFLQKGNIYKIYNIAYKYHFQINNNFLDPYNNLSMNLYLLYHFLYDDNHLQYYSLHINHILNFPRCIFHIFPQNICILSLQNHKILDILQNNFLYK